METYLQNIAGHHCGKMNCWDVVKETNKTIPDPDGAVSVVLPRQPHLVTSGRSYRHCRDPDGVYPSLH
ncbi:hypothetical protein Spica_2609 [Gracilinema caldarium DSM 7334]|uniref:Uncharacterized protein n=1 Tax=Gracilinema caldarium (strain ATCC 51460 / DSM 7334 / H1) TaxID=744872 RepID=F8EY46_GRAC1|nr:hypothetical protein Spica_2609 [Gracilinema caldarium DSM 7334]